MINHPNRNAVTIRTHGGGMMSEVAARLAAELTGYYARKGIDLPVSVVAAAYQAPAPGNPHPADANRVPSPVATRGTLMMMLIAGGQVAEIEATWQRDGRAWPPRDIPNPAGLRQGGWIAYVARSDWRDIRWADTSGYRAYVPSDVWHTMPWARAEIRAAGMAI